MKYSKILGVTTFFQRRMRLVMLRTNRFWPFSSLNRLPYHIGLNLFTNLVKNIEGVKAVYLRHGMLGEWVPGDSDIDLTIVIERMSEEDEYDLLAKAYRIYLPLRFLFPFLADVRIIDTHEFITDDPLARNINDWRLLYGLECRPFEEPEEKDKTMLPHQAGTWFHEYLTTRIIKDDFKDGYVRPAVKACMNAQRILGINPDTLLEDEAKQNDYWIKDSNTFAKKCFLETLKSLDRYYARRLKKIPSTKRILEVEDRDSIEDYMILEGIEDAFEIEKPFTNKKQLMIIVDPKISLEQIEPLFSKLAAENKTNAGVYTPNILAGETISLSWGRAFDSLKLVQWVRAIPVREFILEKISELLYIYSTHDVRISIVRPRMRDICVKDSYHFYEILAYRLYIEKNKMFTVDDEIMAEYLKQYGSDDLTHDIVRLHESIEESVKSFFIVLKKLLHDMGY